VGTSRLAVTTRREVRGEVLYNDGNFAEIQTIGTEGIERGLLLDTVQIHRSDTDDGVTAMGEQQTLREHYASGITSV
jgi:hypothetical protein